MGAVHVAGLADKIHDIIPKTATASGWPEYKQHGLLYDPSCEITHT